MSREPCNGVCEAGDKVRDHCKVWMRDGKGMGGKRAGGQMGIGGGGGPGKATRFPTVATVPDPRKMRWERRWVPLAGRIAEGREPRVGIEGGVRIDGQEGPILTVATPTPTVEALHAAVRSYQRDQNPKQWYHCWLGPGVSTR